MLKKTIFLLLFCPFIAFSQYLPQEVEVIVSITQDDYPNSFVQEIFNIKDLPKGIYLINTNSDKSIINKTVIIE